MCKNRQTLCLLVDFINNISVRIRYFSLEIKTNASLSISTHRAVHFSTGKDKLSSFITETGEQIREIVVRYWTLKQKFYLLRPRTVTILFASSKNSHNFICFVQEQSQFYVIRPRTVTILFASSKKSQILFASAKNSHNFICFVQE
jgi:hypothetical protein